jgi:hypothetical protein
VLLPDDAHAIEDSGLTGRWSGRDYANIVSDRDGDQTGRWLRVRKELPSEMPLA